MQKTKNWPLEDSCRYMWMQFDIVGFCYLVKIWKNAVVMHMTVLDAGALSMVVSDNVVSCPLMPSFSMSSSEI